MASKRKQTTLFKYNFKKKVEHKGTLVDINWKDFLDNESGVFKCTNCKDSFLSKQNNFFFLYLISVFSVCRLFCQNLFFFAIAAL